MDYISISKLKPNSESSPIKVRVSRKWDVYSHQGMFISTEFVFVDEEANSIHAIVWPSNVRHLKDKLKEGSIYHVKNFYVNPNKEKYRVITKNDLMLELNGETTVKIAEEDNKEIPMHAFEFVQLKNLKPDVNEPLIDVIGVLSAIGNVQEQNIRGSLTKFLDLEIVNIKGYRVRVRPWDRVADNFKGILSSKSKEVNIGIFAAMSVKIFSSKVYLSSSSCTMLYVNDDIEEITQMRLNLENYENLGEIIGDQGQFTLNFNRPPAKFIDIVDILKLEREDRRNETTYYFNGKIIHFLKQKPWYYLSCGANCKKGLQRREDGYWCKNCNKIVKYPYPRFRLELMVEDETEKTIVIIFDEGAEFIIKAKAVDLISQEQDSESDEIFMPEQIKSIMGNEYSFYTKPSTLIEDEYFGTFICIKVTNVPKVNNTESATKIDGKHETQSETINDMKLNKRARELDSGDENSSHFSTPAQVMEKQKKSSYSTEKKKLNLG